MSPAAEDLRYRHAEQCWQRGEAVVALAELDSLVAEAPAHPNAHNLAGWILRTALSAVPDALPRAIAHFEAARMHEPDSRTVACNLADALLAAGRPGEAVATMQAVLDESPSDAHANNWMGWHRLVHTDDVAAAIAQLELAARGWFGPAHVNLGRARERSGDLVGAEQAYAQALHCRDVHDPALVHARLAAFARERGHLRRALSGFRHAAWHERASKGVRLAEILAAAEQLEDTLLRAGAYFPHARDEAGWIDDIEAARHTDREDPRRGVPTAAALADEIHAAQLRMRGGPAPLRNMLEHMHVVITAWSLAPALAGVRLTIDADARLAVRWRRAQRLLYVRLCDRDEPCIEAEPMAALARAIAEDDDERALAQLAGLARDDAAGLLDCVGVCEAAGDDAQLAGRPELAARYLAFALEAWQWHASGASSGGEGLARMLDVQRVRDKIAGLRR